MQQSEMFPEIASEAAKAAKAKAERDVQDAREVLKETLPQKATVTVPEAAEALGVSVRQVEYLISDGTLLAVYANRQDEAAKQHARPIVRSNRAFDPNRKKFLTLDEFRQLRSNING